MCGFAQKKPLDFSVYQTWPYISEEKISNDGRFISYRIGTMAKGYSVFVVSANQAWKKQIETGHDAFFLEDSKRLVSRKSGDSMVIVGLGNDSIQEFAGIGSVKSPKKGEGQWLAYTVNGPLNDLQLLNYFTHKIRLFKNVEAFDFSDRGLNLVMETEKAVILLDLKTEKIDTLCHDCNLKRVVFDESEKQLAFLSTKQKDKEKVTKLRYFWKGLDSALILEGSQLMRMERMVVSDDDLFFDSSGRNIFFNIERPFGDTISNSSSATNKIQVYHYWDEEHEFLQSKGPFLAVFHLHGDHRVIRLQQDHDVFTKRVNNGNCIYRDYAILQTNSFGAQAEHYWRSTAIPDFVLVSADDGSRRMIKKSLVYATPVFSANGKYLLWFDPSQKHWFSFNIGNGITKNITEKISTPLNFENDHPDFSNGEGIAGWFENDEGVLIYDRFDIWLVDPSGKKSPINITNGYGLKNDVRLRCMTFNTESIVSFHKNDAILLSAVYLHNKNNGFFSLISNRKYELNRLVMGPKSYYFPATYANVNGLPNSTDQFLPIKAKKANVYLLKPTTASEYPNLCVTSDFRNFRQLTNLAPQKEYKWFTTELVHWNLFSGKKAEGILFKPENFDAHIKYPVIYLYYEKCSDALNAFWNPGLCEADISIPWFVSNGYIVFIPDIYFEPGLPGESVLNTIVSSAKYLSGISWVDSQKMGIQGHSFGGWETNYLVTHTSLFAAAVSASAVSDLVSSYNQLDGNRRTQWYYETRQGRIGASLWDNPRRYILNSPVFRANKVTTPLLIMHNRKDGAVNYFQGEEMYSALDRLGKKVWMLSYENEGHIIENENNQMDYSIRLSQFFDYYLKGTPPPKWMTEGGTNLELDKSGKQP